MKGNYITATQKRCPLSAKRNSEEKICRVINLQRNSIKTAEKRSGLFAQFFSTGMLGRDEAWPGLWDDKGKAAFSEGETLEQAEQMKGIKLPEADRRGVRAEPATTHLHRDWRLGTSRHLYGTGHSVTSKHPDKE